MPLLNGGVGKFWPEIILTHYRPAMPFGNRNIYLEDLFTSEWSQFKKYHWKPEM